MAYFSVGEISCPEDVADILEGMNGREVEESPRRVKGKDERRVCSFGSVQC
jgi:hypothetical protein